MGVLDLLEGALDPGWPGLQAVARGCRLIRASGGARQGQGVGFPPPGMAMGRAGSVGSAWDVKAGKLGGGAATTLERAWDSARVL